MGYSFGMTDNEFTCFLKKASCCIGDGVAGVILKKQSGQDTEECCEKAELLEEYLEVMQCWGINKDEQDAYVVINFTQRQDWNVDFTLSILTYTYHYTFLASLTLNQNLTNLIGVINAGGVFTAVIDGTNVWVYAPSGYNTVPIEATNTSSPPIDIFTVYTPNFMCGVDACSSDCITEDEAGNIIENIKNLATCGC